MTTATATSISSNDDTINFQDITDRVEWIEIDEADDEKDEYVMLVGLLDETRGYGGDHQWNGDWYPGYLIRDSHFEAYAEELADSIGAINDAAMGWPANHIDWKAAAEELQIDYSTVEFDGVTFWYR